MAVVATGFFDGVHRGHARVIDTLLAEASARGTESVVVTFWPHPRAVLRQDARSLGLLTSQQEKKRLLLDMGVSRVEVLEFNADFASWTAERYLSDYVRDTLGAEAVVLGYDNRLGSDLLLPDQSAALAKRLGLGAAVVPPEYFDSKEISSTRIRTALLEGRVEDAASMLGRPYMLRGAVVAGNRMGRTIGFPTANLRMYEPLKVLPAPGAYFTQACVQGRCYPSMTNIDHAGKTETHILGFDEDIYGLDLAVSFIRRLRDEIRFENFEALRARLEEDKRIILLSLREK